MILIDSLLYKIDQRLNKLSSNTHQEIPLEDKILALNEAQLKLIQQKVTGTVTNTGIGLEGSKKRYEDLQILVEPYEDHPLDLTLTDKRINEYSSDISSLTPEYMYYLDAYILADKGKCIDRPIWINRDLLKHGDLQFVLNNEHYKPSFEYQETCLQIASNKVFIYTDGTFKPTKLYISYLRYPKYIDKEGYVKLDGTNSKDENCELNDYLEAELLDLTVQNLAMYVENLAAVQTSQLRIQTNE